MSDIRPKWTGNAFAVLLVLTSLPWVFANSSRPLAGPHNILNTDRTSLYFQALGPNSKIFHRAAVAFFVQAVGQCNRVGLDLSANDLEYPIWVLLRQETGRSIRIDAVGVQNPSRNLSAEAPAGAPCAIFVWNSVSQGNLHVGSTLYSKAYSNRLLAVYLPR